VVLDLGSGGGIDAALASQQVGHGGRVIGVDMTPEMIEKARSLAEEMGLRGVEFRLGEIEDIPVDDNSVDVVISNCVINLSLDKPKVFREVHRVLRPGGRMVISDVVLTRELPESIRTNPGAIAGCIAGAVTLGKYLDTIIAEGIVLERVTARPWSPCPEPDSPDPLARKILDSIPEVESLQGVALSVAVIARKPE
jgi:SAM-dependent methyltransferase